MRERRGLQYGIGGEFGENPRIDDYCRRVVGLLPGIERYKSLVVLASLEERGEETISRLTVRSGRDEVTATVAPDIKSFQEYCRGNEVKGMILVVPGLETGFSFPVQRALTEIFEGIGEVKNPDKYKVWVVDKSAADLFTQPKKEYDRNRLVQKKKAISDLGLCGVRYRHCQDPAVGWFEARPYKKRQAPKERDYSRDERIKFLQNWMRMVIEYRGGEIISASELQGKLERSRSYLTATQNIADARGVYSQEACGCLVHTDLKGNLAVVVKCEKEGCFEDEKPRDPKPNFRLGQKYPWIKCGDCGEETTKIAVWADIGSFNPEGGIKVRFKIICSQFEGHCSEGAVFVDPARIQNPEYIFYSLRRRRGGLKKAA